MAYFEGYGRGKSKKADYLYPSYTSKSHTTRYYGGKGGRTVNLDSWKSYYSFWDDLDKDDNSDLIVKNENLNYELPTGKDIKSRVRSARNKDSQDFIKELSAVCYLKMIGDKDWKHPNANPFEMNEKELSKFNKKSAIFEWIYDNYVPGFTPLEQACHIYLKVGSTDEEDDGINFNEMKKNPDMDLQFDREIYTDPTINEQLELNEFSKERKMEIMNKISIIGDLGSEFKVEKEVEEKIVANSDIFSNKIMRDYSQLQMVNLYQKMLPTFRTKLLTKDLIVNVPVERKEQKQKIIIILDFSGSMNEWEKQTWVNALLIDRFRYVIKGEAEVFFSYFVHSPNHLFFKHVKDKEDVIDFWQTFSNDPNGGTTNVGGMITRIKEEIDSKKLINLNVDLSEEKPEILVINDGQDEIGFDSFPYKTNAVCLLEYNDELKNLCINTGGKKVYVESTESITSYSKTGKEKIV
jgi:hypothetical protein